MKYKEGDTVRLKADFAYSPDNFDGWKQLAYPEKALIVGIRDNKYRIRIMHNNDSTMCTDDDIQGPVKEEKDPIEKAIDMVMEGVK